MLLKGKWVLVKQESLLWWHVLRWGEVIWPVAGPVYVRNVSWNAMCVLCRGENTKDSGLCRIHVKIICFTLYFSCITSARKKGLRMQSSGGWSHWICHSMDNGVFWGWNHGIMKYLLAQRASHFLSQSVYAGGSGADPPLHGFTSSWSLPPCSPSLQHGISNPHATTALHARTHSPPWTSCTDSPSSALHSCCVEPKEEGEGSMEDDGLCLHSCEENEGKPLPYSKALSVNH